MSGAVDPLLLAHAGHWAVFVLYAVPILVVVGSIVLSMRRDRRGKDGGES
jgi:hypothetical protein